MTESDEYWKKRALERKKGLVRQGFDEKDKPSDFEKDLSHGLRVTTLQRNHELERWELYGSGISDLKKCLSSNSERAIRDLAGWMLNKVDEQISQINLWTERAEKYQADGHISEYAALRFELGFFKVTWNNGKEMEIALRTVEEPGFDHSQDLVLILQKPPEQ